MLLWLHFVAESRMKSLEKDWTKSLNTLEHAAKEFLGQKELYSGKLKCGDVMF